MYNIIYFTDAPRVDIEKEVKKYNHNVQELLEDIAVMEDDEFDFTYFIMSGGDIPNPCIGGFYNPMMNAIVLRNCDKAIHVIHHEVGHLIMNHLAYLFEYKDMDIIERVVNSKTFIPKMIRDLQNDYCLTNNDEMFAEVNAYIMTMDSKIRHKSLCTLYREKVMAKG